MIICHVCKAECEEDNELCPICGAQLITQEPEIAEDSSATKSLNNPTLLASMEDVVSAEIFKDILKDNNILFTCDSEADGGAMHITFGGSFVAEDIYVDESDFDTAKELYEEFLASEEQAFFFDDDEIEEA